MRAHQIMTRKVITVKPDTSIVDAANTMLQQHISGLPVVNEAGNLVGIRQTCLVPVHKSQHIPLNR